MQLGAMNNPMVDVVEEIEMYAELGFDFLDLTLEPQAAYSATINTKPIIKALERNGMGVVGHTAWYLPIASPFPELREIALNELERSLRVLAEIGAKKMNVHPFTTAPLHDKEWVITQNIAAMARLADYARNLDMVVLLENIGGFSRVADFGRVLEAVSDIEMLIDVAHANLDTPYIRTEELLANYGNRLGHVHISDNRGGTRDEHLPLGVGNINWLGQVRLLKNAGYDGTITVEVFGEDDDYLVMSRNKFKKLWDSVEAGEKQPEPLESP